MLSAAGMPAGCGVLLGGGRRHRRMASLLAVLVAAALAPQSESFMVTCPSLFAPPRAAGRHGGRGPLALLPRPPAELRRAALPLGRGQAVGMGEARRCRGGVAALGASPGPREPDPIIELLGEDDDLDLFGDDKDEETSMDGSKIVGTLQDGTPVVMTQTSGVFMKDPEALRTAGTESNANTLITAIKVIIGGVAPLFVPWTIRTEGALGGTIAILSIGLLCSFTVRQLLEYKDGVLAETGRDDLSYVDVAEHAFGPWGANLVFVMTAGNALGIVAAYLGFIGPTLATMSATEGSLINGVLPALSVQQYQLAAAGLIVPLNSLAGDPRFLSLAAYAGAFGVGAAVLATLAYGYSVTPDLLTTFSQMRLFTTPSEFFSSFGIVPLLFAVHFAVLPIERNMAKRYDFSPVVQRAVAITIAGNVFFGVLGYAFFGEETASVVLENVASGPVTQIVKLLLVFDMVVSAPIVLSSLREIVESKVLGEASEQQLAGQLALRASLVAAAVTVAQANSIETIANLVGGVAQNVLAFVIPPALAIVGARRWGMPGEAAGTAPDEDVDLSPGGREAVMMGGREGADLAQITLTSGAIIAFGLASCAATIVASLSGG